MTPEGVSYIHVPYKGTADQMLAVAGKTIMVGVNSTGFAPYVEPPHILLSLEDGYSTNSFMLHEEAFAALAKGEIDAAILWGPNAGFENQKSQQGRWRITPVTGQGFSGQMAVAVRKGNDTLLAGMDKALTNLQPNITTLAHKYGFPLEKPLLMAHALQAAPVAAAVSPPQASSPKQGLAVPVVDSAASSPDALKAGRIRFNDACSHCHGTDGYSPVIERDLRQLKMRYKDEWKDTATSTIKNGKPDAGMSTWKDVLSGKVIQAKTYSFQ